MKRKPSSPVVAASVILLLLLLASFMPQWLTSHSPSEMDLGAVLKPPGWQSLQGKIHLLGTDQLGHDILARTLRGIRTSFVVSLGGVLVAGLLGVTIGVVAGYYKGWFDIILMRLAELYLPFPFIILVMILTVVFRPSATTVILGLGLSAWIIFARVVRASTLKAGTEPYVEAAHAIGAHDHRIISGYILPNIHSPIISLVTLELSLFVVAEATLSFLGFGVQPPDVSLGLMIAGGRTYATTNWWVITIPGIAAALLSICFHFLASHFDS